MAYTLTKIAASYNRSITATWEHIQQLKEKKLFEKRSPGKQYNERELKQLERLMDFKYREQS